jgi:hypothetical protein
MKIKIDTKKSIEITGCPANSICVSESRKENESGIDLSCTLYQDFEHAFFKATLSKYSNTCCHVDIKV